MTLTSPSLNASILASSIPLHSDNVKYLAYEGDHTAVWDVRRKIVEEEEANHTEILFSTLSAVQIVTRSIHRLWLFNIGNYSNPNSKPLQDQRLVKVFESTIVPRYLYPCSEECSFHDTPCINCHSPDYHSTYPAARYLPRRPWRRPWHAFLDAVRAALIRGVNYNNTASDETQKHWALALKNGFIVANTTMRPNSDEWVTSGWEQIRPLLYVHVQIHPTLDSSPRLIVHPTVLQTPYCTLGQRPIAGTALTLLPHGTPAYFVAAYSGPTSALTAQFRNALRGLAVDGWEGPDCPKRNSKGRGEAQDVVKYVIVFIPVHTGSEDQKGLTVIYPSLLALAIPPSVRPTMNASLLPTLPAPLQPSPMVPAAIVSGTPSVATNGALSSPSAGPRSAYQFPPPGPSYPPATANTFPTLNSPVVFAPGLIRNQPQPQRQQQLQPPLYSQAASNSGNIGGTGTNAGPGTPFPLSTSAPSTLASPFTQSHSVSPSMDSHTNRSGTLSNNDLLRAHRVASTASRLFALASLSPVNTPAAVPTPGVPTPGTVSVPTPGGRSSPSSLPLMNIPGSTTSTLYQTAAEVSAYVEYVAREREKERERLKEVQAQRNRVTSSSSVANSGASTSASSNSNFGLRSVPPISIPPSVPPPFTGAIMHSGTDAQLFYPSPPTNPPSVSAAGVAVSPTAYQGTALLPQIPQGLPSMHDTSVASSRISPSVSGTTSEVNKIVEGIMDISTIEISHDITQGPLPETDASGTDTDNGIVNTGLPLTNVNAPPLVTTERLSSASMTAPQPIVRSAPATNSDPTSGWAYFGSEGADFDGLGMLGNIGMSGIDSLTGNGMTTDNVDMTLFGAGGGNTFNFENLDSFGGGMDWNMDSTFSFGSGLTSATSTSDQSTKFSTGGVHTGIFADTRPTNASFSSFQSADVFSQPMPPPTAPAVTAPTQISASGTQQLGGGPGSGLGIGMDFEADFTDDDFSFFDNKASNTVNPAEPSSDSLILSTSAPANAATSPDPLAFLNSDDSSSFFSSLGLAPPLPIGSAPTPGFYGYPSHPTPFSISHPTPGGPTGFTPLTVDVEVEVEMNPGLPSPPEETDHPFAKAYEVQLEQGSEASPFRISSVHTPPPTLTSYSPPAPSSPSKDKKFAPIPFAKSHSQADGKYRVAGGKFALLRNSGKWLHKKYRPAYFTLDAPRRARAASWTEIMQGASSNGCFGEQVDLSEKDSRINGPSQGRWCLPSPPVDSDTTDSSAGESDDDEPHTSLEPPPPPTSISDASPPPPTGSTNISTSSSSYTHKTSRPGWRPRYDRATDPRIGVVRRLTWSKQKSNKRLKRAGWSEITTRPKWLKDWEDDTGRHIDVANTGQSQDEAEDDEDEDGGTADEEQDTDGGTLEELDDTPDMKASRRSGGREWSRSATPLPAYLPPGPSLVSTCFHWVHLASMAVGDNVSQTSTTEGMIHDSAPTPIHLNRGVGTTHGAPTPVSPVALAESSATSFPTPAPTWPQALTPSADIDFIPEEEKAWSLETAVNCIAQECVENPFWADAWKSMDEVMGNSKNGAVNPESSRCRNGRCPVELQWDISESLECVWPSDVYGVKQLLAKAVLGDQMLSLGDLFEAWSPPTPEPTPKMAPSTQTSRPICSSGSTPPTSSCTLTPLSPPLLSVAKSEAIIHIMPTALRFWDKLGLGPKSGKKDVTVFVLYEQGYPEAEQHDRLGKAKIWRDEQIGSWLRNVCALYKVKRLGEMLLGKSSLCQKDGLVSFQFGTSFRRSLTSFIASLPAPRDSFVFFILVPLAVMNLASETLHHVSSTINKVLSQYSEVQAVFQLIPEPYVLNTVVHPSSLHDFRSESFVHSVYNRILIPTDRAMSRKFFTYGQREKRYFEVPAFTLAHVLSENKVSYSSSVDPALDVLDRHTFLHVGYRISLCGRWILAACIDQRGEAHAMGVWSTQPYTPTDKNKKNDEFGVDVPVISDEMYIVNKVWDFAMQLAEKANVEWRIVIAKSGNMSVIELDAWITHLYTALHSNVQAPMHVSLLNVDQSVPWIILPFPTPQSTGHSAPNSKNPTLFRSTPGSAKISSKNQLFVDTATTTYGLLQKDTLPISVPPTLNDIGLSTDLVINKPLSIDDDDYSLVDDYPLLPLSSSTLICMPDSSVLPQMVNIHLIYATKSEGCAYPNITLDAADSPQTLLHDITNSFYSLSVLSAARWDIAGPSLPFHLSAVETMRKALSTRNGVDSMR